jgi:hypothetical protein
VAGIDIDGRRQMMSRLQRYGDIVVFSIVLAPLVIDGLALLLVVGSVPTRLLEKSLVRAPLPDGDAIEVRRRTALLDSDGILLVVWHRQGHVQRVLDPRAWAPYVTIHATEDHRCIWVACSHQGVLGALDREKDQWWAWRDPDMPDWATDDEDSVIATTFP